MFVALFNFILFSLCSFLCLVANLSSWHIYTLRASLSGSASPQCSSHTVSPLLDASVTSTCPWFFFTASVETSWRKTLTFRGEYQNRARAFRVDHMDVCRVDHHFKLHCQFDVNPDGPTARDRNYRPWQSHIKLFTYWIPDRKIHQEIPDAKPQRSWVSIGATEHDRGIRWCP